MTARGLQVTKGYPSSLLDMERGLWYVKWKEQANRIPPLTSLYDFAYLSVCVSNSDYL